MWQICCGVFIHLTAVVNREWTKIESWKYYVCRVDILSCTTLTESAGCEWFKDFRLSEYIGCVIPICLLLWCDVISRGERWEVRSDFLCVKLSQKMWTEHWSFPFEKKILTLWRKNGLRSWVTWPSRLSLEDWQCDPKMSSFCESLGLVICELWGLMMRPENVLSVWVTWPSRLWALRIDNVTRKCSQFVSHLAFSFVSSEDWRCDPRMFSASESLGLLVCELGGLTMSPENVFSLWVTWPSRLWAPRTDNVTRKCSQQVSHLAFSFINSED
jgi:hypothetical protein